MARSDSKVDAPAWRNICDWVAANTPADACFLTPRGAASFTWWTGRRDYQGAWTGPAARAFLNSIQAETFAYWRARSPKRKPA
jgi:hypothetical protein